MGDAEELVERAERATPPPAHSTPPAASSLDAIIAQSSPPIASRLVPWLILIIMVAAITAAAWFVATRETPIAVDVFIASRGDVERTVPSVSAGRIVARRRARVAAQTVGRIVEVCAKKGDRVAKDQAIVRLDDVEAKANVSVAIAAHTAAIAAVDEARARVATTRAVRERRLKQREADISTPETLDLANMDVAAAEAGLAVVNAHVEEAKARVDVAKAILEKHSVRAPFDGVLSDVWAEAGESTTAAGAGPQSGGSGKANATLAMETMSRLFEVIALDDLYVTAPVDEVDLSRVATGLAARVTLDPWPKEPFTGKVVRVAPFVLDVEEQNRTVEVEVEVPDAWRARGLRPGISADVEVVVERRESVLRLPSHALLEGQRALVIETDAEGRERAVERKIEKGIENWRAVEVLSGVHDGERVVASAVDGSKIRSGALVRVRNVLEEKRANGETQKP